MLYGSSAGGAMLTAVNKRGPDAAIEVARIIDSRGGRLGVTMAIRRRRRHLVSAGT